MLLVVAQTCGSSLPSGTGERPDGEADWHSRANSSRLKPNRWAASLAPAAGQVCRAGCITVPRLMLAW
eukprot:1273101-Amphidinium_carterae.1